MRRNRSGLFFIYRFCVEDKSLINDAEIMGKVIAILVLALLACDAWAMDANFVLDKPQVMPKQKLIMGWLESIFIKPWNRRLTAKLDTGAKTSSLHADNIEHFSKGGEDWVRFNLGDIEDKDLRPIRVERPLLRTVNIKCKGEDCQPSKRDVIMLTICKNGRDFDAEFNLVDRSNFNYPVLLGRSFLKGVALVDAAETFLFKADQDPCAAHDGFPGRD